jgi:hypothetical protein
LFLSEWNSDIKDEERIEKATHATKRAKEKEKTDLLIEIAN